MPDPKPEPTEQDLWNEFAAIDESEDGSFGTPIAETGEKDNDAPAGQPAAPAQEPQPVRQESATDIWANAPPDLKAAHDAQVRALELATTEHARRSIEGRISAYTRRLAERTAAAAQPPGPAKKEEEAADPFEELAADYPEIAGPLQKDRQATAEKIARVEALERSRIEAADAQMDADLMANEDMLEAKHPGWENYLKEYGQAFTSWIEDQPLALRRSFVINREAIVDPYSAIETLDAFKSFVESNQNPTPQPPAGAQPQRLNSRRAAQLAGSASPNTGGSRPVVSGIPPDGNEQDIWNAFRDIDPDEAPYRAKRN